MRRRLVAASVALFLASANLAAAAEPPASWDGLSRVKSKKVDAVYLDPTADFRAYTKVQMDPTEVAFEKHWLRDYNSGVASLGGRISDAEAQQMLDKARTGFEQIFRETYEQAGYQVVTAAGPDVLRVRTAVLNLTVDAPDQMSAARSRTYAAEAGEATLVLEARDSLTGDLLGRVVDKRLAGDGPAYIRNSVTNRADFSQLFKAWAKTSVRGLDELKATAAAPAQAAAAK